MHLRVSIGNAGIEAGVHASNADRVRLMPDLSVSQSNPRDCYVYAHLDPQGRIFYIGKGSGRRAWSKDREKLWLRYVDFHLGGTYTVQILADGLSPSDAEALEAEWVDQENEGLINLQNMARRIDVDGLRRRDELMAQNKSLIEQAKLLERISTEEAINLYRQALAQLKQFAVIPIETGLYGKILSEDIAANGPIGQISLLDRLTLCLVRAGRRDEARDCAEEYFAFFKSELRFAAAKKILERVKT